MNESSKRVLSAFFVYSVKRNVGLSDTNIEKRSPLSWPTHSDKDLRRMNVSQIHFLGKGRDFANKFHFHRFKHNKRIINLIIQFNVLIIFPP
jgi:hypothetical protein